MEIMSLKPEQKKRAAVVLAAAFYDYPQITYYFPDQKRRAHWLTWYMERDLIYALSYGEVFVTEDISGVLFYLPPGHTRLSDEDYVRNGLRRATFAVGLNRYSAVSECEAYLADAQDRLMAGRPHYYLWGLVTDPAKQRTGTGTALLRAFVKKADAENLPVYLETHMEQNVTYYEQRGFRLIHKDSVPEHNLDFWCLLHEPNEEVTQR